MVEAMILLDASEPLPLNATFQTPADGSVIFVLSGTVWTQEAPCLIGLNLFIDGQVIGNPAMCFANANAVHMAMRTTFIMFDNLSFGNHTITVQPYDSNSITDPNDAFQVTMFY